MTHLILKARMFTGLEVISCVHPGPLLHHFPASYKILIHFAPGKSFFYFIFFIFLSILGLLFLFTFPYFSFFLFLLLFLFFILFLSLFFIILYIFSRFSRLFDSSSPEGCERK